MFFKISHFHFIIYGKDNVRYVLCFIDEFDNTSNFAIYALNLLRNLRLAGHVAHMAAAEFIKHWYQRCNGRYHVRNLRISGRF